MHTHEYSTSDGSVARLFHLSDGSLSDSYESFGSCSDFQDCPMTAGAENPLESGIEKLHLDKILSSDSMDIDKASPTKVTRTLGHHEPLSRPNAIWQKREHIEVDHGTHKPFHRWVKSLRRRAAYRRSILPNCETPLYQPFHSAAIEPKRSWPSRHSHQKSSSGSSFGFVTAVRSTGVSLSSFGTAAKPRLSASMSHGLAGTDRSSRASMSITRTSEDSSNVENTCTLDVTQIERSLQRRRILEEIINTEESYIGDVRFLMNIYVTIFASHQSVRAGLRSSINRILADIIELHEDILGELHRAVPHSEYTQIEYDLCHRMTTKRRPSLSTGLKRRKGAGGTSKPLVHLNHLRDIPGMIAEPQVAAEVARIFNKKMSRFFIYEEYGASYETLMNDIASSKESLPEWSRYQKGLEILGSTIGATRNFAGASSKALSINDLLVKPIQRVCRYPLLFNELSKYTSTFDCPNSQMEVESTLDRLREATTAINTAKDDKHLRAILEKTWLLQDRLSFSDQRFDAVSKSRIRSFGHIQLCGALHISWPTKEGVSGRYIVCLLYTDVLCLASAGKADVMYTIHACIHIDRARVENPDSGRGLQCHNAPFCWKLVFKCDHQLYEILMTACTAVEEIEWRTRLTRPMRKEVEASSFGGFCSLDLDVQSVGPVFGKPGTIARRISVHRAATIGSKAPTTQVIIKNTSGSKDGLGTSSAASTVSRSQSLLATRVPVLAPPRSERARIEALLSDVWSHDRLPCPGMTARSRPDYLVRSSASTVMRKLSVASIASSLSKRSGSTKQKKKTSDSISSPLSPESQGGHEQVDGSHTRPGEIHLAHEAERGVKRLRTASHTKSEALAPVVKDEDVMRPCKAATFPMAPSSLPNMPSLAAHAASSFPPSRSVKYNHPPPRLDGDLQAASMKQRSKSLHSKASGRQREGSGHSFRGMFK